MQPSLAPKTIHDYCLLHADALLDACQKIHAETQHITGHQMLCDISVLNLLKCLIRLNQSQNILEIGTYTGFSALSMAETLSQHGKLTTIEQAPLSH